MIARALWLRTSIMACTVLALAATSLAQQPKPLADGDAKAGKVLAERDCVTCHSRQFGDAATIYTRADRRVHSPEQLLAQVRYCNIQLKSGYFPEEEEHVAAYLNQQFYKFKP